MDTLDEVAGDAAQGTAITVECITGARQHRLSKDAAQEDLPRFQRHAWLKPGRRQAGKSDKAIKKPVMKTGFS
ncbi:MULTISPECIES: hypothetical protein [Ralstonia solanacearum species complex]|uniref:Uncharacterized protein n=1 Tax=Ralstonia syzygii TaxID=28097 RepID=A0ABX7ZEM3_9RALS|nr:MULTISPECIES: hypothetical protein [Ralstonia solanacearum species complex]QUP53682.1 hypothetical protein GO998_07885 [Ralstonia syzygii]